MYIYQYQKQKCKKCDYTQNYNSAGVPVTTAVYFYGDSLNRAAAAEAEDCMKQINTYRGDKIVTGLVHTDLTDIKSITYNEISQVVIFNPAPDFSHLGSNQGSTAGSRYNRFTILVLLIEVVNHSLRSYVR